MKREIRISQLLFLTLGVTFALMVQTTPLEHGGAHKLAALIDCLNWLAEIFGKVGTSIVIMMLTALLCFDYEKNSISGRELSKTNMQAGPEGLDSQFSGKPKQ